VTETITDAWDRIARVGEEPTRSQPKRVASRDVRIGDRLTAGMATITETQVLVPRGTRYSALPPFVARIPRGFAGALPLRAGSTPYWLAQCVGAPPKLFDLGFGQIWLRTHLAVQEQLDATGVWAQWVPDDEAETLPNYEVDRAVALGSVDTWMAAAGQALDASREGLRGRL